MIPAGQLRLVLRGKLMAARPGQVPEIEQGPARPEACAVPATPFGKRPCNRGGCPPGHPIPRRHERRLAIYRRHDHMMAKELFAGSGSVRPQTPARVGMPGWSAVRSSVRAVDVAAEQVERGVVAERAHTRCEEIGRDRVVVAEQEDQLRPVPPPAGTPSSRPDRGFAFDGRPSVPVTGPDIRPRSVPSVDPSLETMTSRFDGRKVCPAMLSSVWRRRSARL